MSKNWLIIVIFGVLLTLLFTYSFKSGFFKNPITTRPENNKIPVSASFYPLADFSRQVGKNKVDVEDMTPAGAEPHDFEPSPQDLVLLQRSKIFLYNGAGFEPWVEKILPDLKSKGVLTVKMSEGTDLLEDTRGTQKMSDPHIWLDPVLAQMELGKIEKALVEIDPTNSSFYEDNANTYKEKLEELNKEFAQGLSLCRQQTVITSHNAFQYLAKRYHFNVLSISGLSPEAEPSPRKIAELADIAKRKQIKYIFFETLVSPNLTQTIAKEVGAQTLVFNPIEGLTPDEQAAGEDYLSIQKKNLVNLKLAMECQ